MNQTLLEARLDTAEASLQRQVFLMEHMPFCNGDSIIRNVAILYHIMGPENQPASRSPIPTQFNRRAYIDIPKSLKLRHIRILVGAERALRYSWIYYRTPDMPSGREHARPRTLESTVVTTDTIGEAALGLAGEYRTRMREDLTIAYFDFAGFAFEGSCKTIQRFLKTYSFHNVEEYE